MNLQKLLSDRTKILILIDGYCLLCHGFARFVLSQDKHQAVRFGALQDEDIIGVLAEHDMSIPDIDSVIIMRDGHMHVKSQAVLQALTFLPRYRQWTRVFFLFPVVRADYIYDYIARHRIGRFGQKEDCDLQSVRELQKRVVSV